jgi:hypothetical protein
MRLAGPRVTAASRSIVAVLACTICGATANQAQVGSAQASLPEPAGWIDLPGAPFVKQLTTTSDREASWTLVNKSSSSFDYVSTGCVVERDGKVHIVGELIAVTVTHGGIEPGRSIEVFSSLHHLDFYGRVTEARACPAGAHFSVTGASLREVRNRWSAEGSPWPHSVDPSSQELALLHTVLRSDALFDRRRNLVHECEVSDVTVALEQFWSKAVTPSVPLLVTREDNNTTIRISSELAATAAKRNSRLLNLRLLSLPASGAWRTGSPMRRCTVRLSRPGIAADGSHAIIGVQLEERADCCPAGYALYLERREAEWVVVARGGYWLTDCVCEP